VRIGWCLCVLIAIAALSPAVALARRLATSRQHAAVVNAAVVAHDLNQRQGRCTQVYISTANTSWAALDFPAKEPKSCLALAANGIAVFHYRSGRWRFLTAGSDFSTCPPRGVPRNVTHDLRLC
jgi:hypothetical protein